jgi:hypothetical protein
MFESAAADIDRLSFERFACGSRKMLRRAAKMATNAVKYKTRLFVRYGPFREKAMAISVERAHGQFMHPIRVGREPVMSLAVMSLVAA